MSRTHRIWNKKTFQFQMKLDIWCNCKRYKGAYDMAKADEWSLTSMDVFRSHKRKYLRKEMRHSIRCNNRSRFSHMWYEPFEHTKIDYFD